MKDLNAGALLAKVMGWQTQAPVLPHVDVLQLLSEYKYDHYQQFAPGRRFIESLALWLNRFAEADRATALEFVMDKLIFVSEAELSHLVHCAYPDVIVQERSRLVAEEAGLPTFRVGAIAGHKRFAELRLKSLYLGLSDGARTSELRRTSSGEISNEQIWQAYELSEDKARDMTEELGKSLGHAGYPVGTPRFNLIWLLDDFSGSGNTYIRFDNEAGRYKGKLPKVYDFLNRGSLVDPSHYEIFLVLYIATRQSIDHIEYWAERFTAERGYRPLHVRALSILEPGVGVTTDWNPSLETLIRNPAHYDHTAFDAHMAVGGTTDAKLGFAGCALPVVLCHNTPNNSIYILWGPEDLTFVGLFPRVARHREF